jgi:hypothetical protein
VGRQTGVVAEGRGTVMLNLDAATLKTFKACGLSIRIIAKVNGGFIVRVGGPS